MDKDNPFEKVVFKIDGMMCQHCVERVEQALNARNGVVVKKARIGKIIASVHNHIKNEDLREIVEKDTDYKIVKIKR